MANWNDFTEEEVEKAMSYSVASPGSYKAKITNIENFQGKESGLNGFKVTWEFDYQDDQITRTAKIFDYWMLQSKDRSKLPSIVWKVKALVTSLGLSIPHNQLIEESGDKQMERLKNLANNLQNQQLKSMVQNLVFFIDVGSEPNTYQGVTKQQNRFKDFIKMEGIENIKPNYNVAPNNNDNGVPF